LQNNELPLSYLDEVVRFIEKNTSGVKIGGSGEYQDPFTGKLMNLVGAFE
jgi:phospholipase A-2-activating protein